MPMRSVNSALHINVLGLAEFAGWCGVCLVFAWFIARGFWLGAGVVLGGLVVFLMVVSRYQDLLMLWMAGIPTVFIYPNNVLHNVLSALTVDRLLFAILALVLIGSWMLKRSHPAPITPVEKAMLLFVGIATLSLLSTAATKSPRALYDGMVLLIQGLVMPFAAFTIAKNQGWTEKRMTRLFHLLMFVGLYLVVTGVLQYYFHMTFFLPTYIEFEKEMGRATGPFFSPTEYGGVLGGLLLLALFQYARSADGVYRTIMLGLAVLFLGGILLCKTRAVWVALLVSLVMICYKDRRMRGPLGTMSVVGGIALLVSLPFLLDSDLFQRRISEQEPIYNRLALYATAGSMIVHNPLFGIGFGRDSFKEAKFDYISSFGDVSAQWAAQPGVPHNEFLHMFLLTGIIGFVVYVTVWYRAYRVLDSVEHQRPGQGEFRGELAVFLKGFFLIFITTAMLSDQINFTYYVTFFYFMIGMVASQRSDDEHAPVPLEIKRVSCLKFSP